MQMRRIKHRGLKRFIESDDGRGIRPGILERVRKVLAVLILASDLSEVVGPLGWRIHQLSGNRQGTWSISVSGNWRITFVVENGEILNLDLEDYHS